MDPFSPLRKKKKHPSSPSGLRRQLEKDALRDMFPSRKRKIPRKEV